MCNDVVAPWAIVSLDDGDLEKMVGFEDFEKGIATMATKLDGDILILPKEIKLLRQQHISRCKV